MLPVFDLKAIPGEFADAWNRHDMKSLAALFTEDAKFVNVVGMWWKSRDEIEAAHAATHATIFKHSRLSFEPARVMELAPGVAAVHARWELAGQLDPDGRPSGPRQGVLLFVVTSGEQGWRVKVAQNTDIVAGVLVPSTRT